MATLEDRIYYGEASYKEYFQYQSKKAFKSTPGYLKSLVPIIAWLPNYNRKWFMGDLVAGITVGLMVVPQALAYTKLANLPVVYGLYSSYIGTILYTLTGTCREIAVGPAAILALLVGSTINKVQKDLPDISAVEMAATLSFLSGLITIGLGIFKLGGLLDLIPHPVVMGFTTGSALTIMLTQIPSLLGIPNVPSNDATPIVIKDLVMNIVNLSWLDLVFGVTSLLFLQILAIAAKKWTSRLPMLRYIKVASNAICVILFTLIAFLIYLNHPNITLKILKTVPQGFGHIGTPNLDSNLLSKLLGDIIPVVLISVLEHVAIAKAFSRKSGYSLDSSQELVALGAGNFFSSFFSGYPTTGAFSRTAISSQSGVRTPLSSSWTGVVVILALWFLTPAFYYIPNATLASIIINSTVSLITEIHVIKDLWKVQKMDCVVFFVACLTTFLAGAELGIICSLGLSFLVLLYHVARPHVSRLARVIGRPHLYIDMAHPGYETEQPLPGVILFRPQESLLFPNIDYLREQFLDRVLAATKPGPLYTSPTEPLWCEDLATRGEKLRQGSSQTSFPTLRAVIFDFSSVNRIDASGLEGLRDLRDQLSHYAGTSLHGNYEKMETTSSLPPGFNLSQFELHFVGTHPKVLSSLELAGITCSVVPNLSSNFYSTIEPIVLNASRFVHLSLADAIRRIQNPTPAPITYTPLCIGGESN